MTTQELEYLVKVNDRDLAELRARTKDLHKALGDETAAASSKGALGLGKLGDVAKAGAVGVLAFGAAAKIGWDEFNQGAAVAAQTQAVLKSSGDAADVTAQHVSDLAGALLKKSGVDDEAIQSGENLLLTFRNIQNQAGQGNDIFDHATKTMLDMSVALGQDTKSSAIQLGKALNDPIKGVTALQRVGVSFTQGQRDQIKAMVDAGDTMGAQKLILGELDKEFGGSAEAVGKTLPGQLNILKETFHNVMGDVVADVVPAMQTTIGWLEDHWPEISADIGHFRQEIKPILTDVAGLFQAVVDVVRDHWPLIERNLDTLKTVVKDAVRIVDGALRLVIDLIHGDWAGAWGDLKQIVGAALDAVKALLVNRGKNLVAAAGALGRWVVDAITAPFKALGGDLRHAIQPVLDVFADIASGAESVLGVIGKVSSAAGAVKGVLSHIPGFAGGVSNFAGGLAIVGEQGPELVRLPAGSDVIPNNRIGSMLAAPRGLGGGVELHVHVGTVIGNRLDDAARELAGPIVSALRDYQARGGSLSPAF